MTDRTAIDTIRGYFYQFDYSILSLLKLSNGTESIFSAIVGMALPTNNLFIAILSLNFSIRFSDSNSNCFLAIDVSVLTNNYKLAKLVGEENTN